MSLIQNDYMVEQIVAKAADPPFGSFHAVSQIPERLNRRVAETADARLQVWTVQRNDLTAYVVV